MSSAENQMHNRTVASRVLAKFRNGPISLKNSEIRKVMESVFGKTKVDRPLLSRAIVGLEDPTMTGGSEKLLINFSPMVTKSSMVQLLLLWWFSLELRLLMRLRNSLSDVLIDGRELSRFIRKELRKAPRKGRAVKMTTVEKPPKKLEFFLRKSVSDLSDCSEVELLEITKASLQWPNLSPTDLERIFSAVLLSKQDRDSSIDQNLGLMAARAGLVREAEAFALDFLESGYPKVSVAIAQAAIPQASLDEKAAFRAIIQKAAQTGHVQSKVSNAEICLQKFGFLKKPLLLVYKIAITPFVFVRAIRNPKDGRFD